MTQRKYYKERPKYVEVIPPRRPRAEALDLSELDDLARSDYYNARRNDFTNDEAYRIAHDDMVRRQAKAKQA